MSPDRVPPESGRGEVSAAQPGAEKLRDRWIVKQHARGHDALDRHGVPRFAPPPADGLPVYEFSLSERIDLLAASLDPGGER